MVRIWISSRVHLHSYPTNVQATWWSENMIISTGLSVPMYETFNFGCTTLHTVDAQRHLLPVLIPRDPGGYKVSAPSQKLSKHL